MQASNQLIFSRRPVSKGAAISLRRPIVCTEPKIRSTSKTFSSGFTVPMITSDMFGRIVHDRTYVLNYLQSNFIQLTWIFLQRYEKSCAGFLTANIRPETKNRIDWEHTSPKKHRCYCAADAFFSSSMSLSTSSDLSLPAFCVADGPDFCVIVVRG